MIIFDEKEYGEYLYENQANPSLVPKMYNVRELTILAKYMKQELHKSESEIRNGIIKFCNLNYPGFDSDVEYERINKVMEEVYKTNLRESLPVPITKKEWEDIEKASTEKRQKLLFGYLVVAKFNRINPIIFEEEDDNEEEKIYKDNRLRCYNAESEIYKIMKIGLNKSEELFETYGEFGRCGLNLVNTLKSSKLKRVLNYGELEPNEEDILLYIDDYNELPSYFLALKDLNRRKVCSSCGKVFIDTSKSNKQYKCKKCKQQRTKIEGNLIRLVCIDCGKVFYVDKHSPKKEGRCEECQIKYKKAYLKEYRKKPQIIKTCEDCGIAFEASPKSQRCKCDSCYKIYRREKARQGMKNNYEKKKS